MDSLCKMDTFYQQKSKKIVIFCFEKFDYWEKSRSKWKKNAQLIRINYLSQNFYRMNFSFHDFFSFYVFKKCHITLSEEKLFFSQYFYVEILSFFRNIYPSVQNNSCEGICSTVRVPLPPITTIPRDGVATIAALKSNYHDLLKKYKI